MGRKAFRRFRLLPHTTDAFLEAYGRSLKEAFENAALGMFSVMSDPGKVRAEREDSIHVEADDEYALLYSWLEQLLLKFEMDGMLYTRFEVDRLERLGGRFVLEARAHGEAFDRGRHPAKLEVKAVTYHRMAINKTDSRFTVRFLLDL